MLVMDANFLKKYVLNSTRMFFIMYVQRFLGNGLTDLDGFICILLTR